MAETGPNRKLTDRQWRFIHEYIIDQNACRAAHRAGYSAASCEYQGPRLVKNALVRAEIDILLAQENAKAKVTRQMILDELQLIAFANIADYAKIDRRGVKLKSFDKLGKKARAVAEVSDSPKTGISLKMNSKLGALKLIGDHLGLFESQRADDPENREAHESRVQKALSEFEDDQ